MRIEFDPTNRDEATAVRAILDVMNPNGWTGAYYAAKPVDAQALTEVGERIIETQEAAPVADVPDLDANNEPHDPRIHSTPAKTNADGTWRAKRGVKAEEIAAVKAERDTEREPVSANETNAPVGEQEIPTAEDPDDPKHVVADPIVTAPPAPPAPIVQPETERSVASYSFLDVMKAITAAQKDGKIDTAKVKELCAAVGAGESTMGLNGPDNGDKRGAFMALLVSETEGK